MSIGKSAPTRPQRRRSLGLHLQEPPRLAQGGEVGGSDGQTGRDHPRAYTTAARRRAPHAHDDWSEGVPAFRAVPFKEAESALINSLGSESARRYAVAWAEQNGDKLA